MTSIHHRGSIKYLGSLRGHGHLTIQGGEQEPSAIVYEIDGFLERGRRSATGHIDGDRATLARVFQAGRAHLTLEGGLALDILLLDPNGGPSAEVTVTGAFPL